MILVTLDECSENNETNTSASFSLIVPQRLYSLSAFAFKVADVLKEMPATKSGLASLWLESGKVNKALDVLNNYAELFEERRQKALLYHNLGVGKKNFTGLD